MPAGADHRRRHRGQAARACSPPRSSRLLSTDILLVGEDAIEHALTMILEIEKTVVEGAAAAGFAAVLEHAGTFKGRKVGIVMSGGNIDMRLLSNVILRELTREGRIITLDVAIADRPAAGAVSPASVGDAGGNILEVSHNRMMAGIPPNPPRWSMVVEARDTGHARGNPRTGWPQTRFRQI